MKDDDHSDDKKLHLVHRATTPADRRSMEDRVEEVLTEALGDLEDDRLDAEDRAAIASEALFLQRFGFDACRTRRRQVLEFKHAADVTDREIRFLHRTGCLTFRDGSVRISGSLFVAVYGWCLMAYFGLLMGVAFGTAVMASRPSVLVAGRLAVFELAMIVVTGLAHHLYVHPRRIFCRVHTSLDR